MLVIYAVMATALIILDQVSKNWAVHTLAMQESIAVVPEVFELRYTENRGVAFSMLQDQRWVFIPVSIAMTAVLILMLMRSPMRKSKLFSIATTMVIAGAIGNLIDRVLLGYVVDFLYFRLIDFPIFNVADCFVVVGAILLGIYCLFGMKEFEELPMRTLLFGVEKKKETDNG